MVVGPGRTASQALHIMDDDINLFCPCEAPVHAGIPSFACGVLVTPMHVRLRWQLEHTLSGIALSSKMLHSTNINIDDMMPGPYYRAHEHGSIMLSTSHDQQRVLQQ